MYHTDMVFHLNAFFGDLLNVKVWRNILCIFDTGMAFHPNVFFGELGEMTIQ